MLLFLQTIAFKPHASDGTYVYAELCRNLSQPEHVISTHKIPATRIQVPNKVYTFEDRVYIPHHKALLNHAGTLHCSACRWRLAYQLAVVVDDATYGHN